MARAMAFREELFAELIIPTTEDRPKGTPVVGVFKVEDSDANVLFEGENKIVTVGINDVLLPDDWPAERDAEAEGDPRVARA